MRIVAAVFFSTLVTACQTVSICSYDLEADGWRAEPHPPVELQTDANRNSHWYTNASGDRLACPALDAPNICGNVYDIFRKTPSGYDRQEIVCTT
jgi:hypothetical protein